MIYGCGYWPCPKNRKWRTFRDLSLYTTLPVTERTDRLLLFLLLENEEKEDEAHTVHNEIQ